MFVSSRGIKEHLVYSPAMHWQGGEMHSDVFLWDILYRVSLLNLWSFALFWQRNISLFSALCYVMLLAEELFRYWLHSSLRPDVCFCSLHVYVKYWRSFPSWCDSSTTCIWILAYLLYYVLFRSVIVLFWTQRVNKYIINDDIHSHGGGGGWGIFDPLLILCVVRVAHWQRNDQSIIVMVGLSE